ncbi:MAG: hypothetical protein IKR27_03265 [Lachnospiraceae bacterium]|nr:hypothetical protein [Lachnospiraceae bacterium]MBR6274015.1 hypothetical protein [Lachnospiraceae bacterium]
MDFLFEILRAGVKFVFLGCVAVTGVLFGKKARDKKDAKKENKNEK